MYLTGPDALARDVAVVTGAAGSIGREIAVGLAENGFDVVVACRPGSEARCANVTSSLWSMRRRAAGRHFYIEPIDFSACLSVGAFVQRVSARYGARLVAIVAFAAAQPHAFNDEPPVLSPQVVAAFLFERWNPSNVIDVFR